MTRALPLLLLFAALAWGAPNFIILMADDAGYGDIGAFGAPTIRTPNIDRLAQEGTKFTQWYAPAPLCTPSRGAALTGRLPGRIGLYSQYGYPLDNIFRVFYPSSLGGLPSNETTIAEALKERGYYSALIGKWHLGHHEALPTRHGFDYFYGTPYSHDEGYPGPFPMSLLWPPVPLYRNEKIVEQPLDMETLTPKMTEEALEVIEQSAGRGQPFFLSMNYHEPHIPLFASKEFEGQSRRGLFGDAMLQMDHSIGAILAKVRELGLEENTLVLFLSDNGAWPDAKEPFTLDNDEELAEGGSNGPLQEGKGSTWEGGMRTPAIAWWPGKIRANQVNMEVASHLDLLPTLVGLAGGSVPTDRVIDGKDIAPLLLEEGQKSPHEAYFYWREGSLMAVRQGVYKAHFFTRSGFGFDAPVAHDPPLLFNVEVDISERYPLNPETHQEILASLIQVAQQHQAGMKFGPPQYDFKHENGPVPGQDWSVIPCCQRNMTEARTGPLPPPNWSLIIWKDCICPRNFPPPELIFAPQAYAETSYFGHKLSLYNELMMRAQEMS